MNDPCNIIKKGDRGIRYSINGYIAAILVRTGKTFLVEGTSDRSTIQQVEYNLLGAKAKNRTIDTADLFDDPTLAGLGNKAKIVKLVSVIEESTETKPKLKSVFGTLIDREWDTVAIETQLHELKWNPPNQASPNFTTLGHSIENYLFNPECTISYLRQHHINEVNDSDLEDKIKKHFESILIFSAVFSKQAHIHNIKHICKNAIGIRHIIFDGENFLLQESFDAILKERGAEMASPFHTLVNAEVANTNLSTEDRNHLHWLPHGHLGIDIIWCLIAKIALSIRLPSNVIRQIESQNKEAKILAARSQLGKIESHDITPLEEATRWLNS